VTLRAADNHAAIDNSYTVGGDLNANGDHLTGVGLGKVQLNVPAGQTAPPAQVANCMTTTNYDTCPQVLTFPGISYTAPEGASTYTTTTTDLVGNSNNGPSWTARVDNSPPVLGPLSGSLWDARRSTLDPSTTYTLNVSATDGSTSTPAAERSGVASIDISVDGQSEEYVSQDCTAATGSCSLSDTSTLDASTLTAGTHTVDVAATDQLGHQSQPTSFTFTTPCCLAAASIFATIGSGYDVRYADVDGDGIDDAIARDKLTGAISVGLSDGTQFAPLQPWGSWDLGRSFDVADVNGDGQADLVGRSATGDIQVGLSTGTSFSPSTSWSSWTPTGTVQFADVDGDGAADIVGYDQTTGVLTIGYSDGTASFEPPLQFGTWDPTYSLTLADVNGDGLTDVAGRNATGDIKVGVSDAGSFSAPASWGTVPTDAEVRFADLNGDGLADLVTRDPDTGAVSVKSSDGTTFGPSTDYGAHYGSLSSGYEFSTAGATGGGESDVIGRNPLTGDITVSRSTAQTPAAAPSPAINDDPAMPVEADATPPTSDGGVPQPPSDSGGNPNPRLAAQDDPAFLYRDPNTLGISLPFAAGQPRAIARINSTLTRLRQMGVTVIRFNVYWGNNENRPDGNGGYAGGTQYYWDQANNRLDAAVDLVRQAGFAVELTFSGVASGNCAGAAHDYNPNGFAEPCQSNGDPATPDGYPPSRDFNAVGDWVNHYARFVRAGVDHFTTGPKGRRVTTFTFWNEPNQPGWLNVAKGDRATATSELYHRIYQTAWSQYKQSIAASGVTGTQALFGELSSRTQPFRSATGSGGCANEARGSRKCTTTPAQYLRDAVRPAGYTDTVRAAGIALHPYQRWANPKAKDYARGRTGDNGIGNLEPFKAEIRSLCSADSQHHCQGRLQSDSQKLPGLYLTEFGYQIAPSKFATGDTKTAAGRQKLIEANGYWHTESTTRSWYRGNLIDNKNTPGALDQASQAHAKWMLFYNPLEYPPRPRPDEPNGGIHIRATSFWDTGLLGFDFSNGLDNGSDTLGIGGTRPYGKAGESRYRYKVYEYPQKRRTYCAIREWVAAHGYLDVTVDPSLKNPCPVPKYAHGGS
jgi:VCBS repeat protein